MNFFFHLFVAITNFILYSFGIVSSKNLEAVQSINKNAQLGHMTHFSYLDGNQVYDYTVSTTKDGKNIVNGMEDFYVTPKDFVVDEYFDGWVYNEEEEQ